MLCVCGLKNGAIVSTRPPPACRDPSACSRATLQRGPCPVPATHYSPSGLGVREGRDMMLFQAPSLHRSYSHTVCDLDLGERTWFQPLQHSCPTCSSLETIPRKTDVRLQA